jgi:hypothetical protein
MPQFQTMGERTWWAWHCLPRDDRGTPPDWRALERSVGLANGTLYKFTWDLTTRPGIDTLEKVASALRTTPEWLHNERGEGPMARWPIPPRPAPPEGAAKRSRHRKKSGSMPAVNVGKR